MKKLVNYVPALFQILLALFYFSGAASFVVGVLTLGTIYVAYKYNFIAALVLFLVNVGLATALLSIWQNV